MVLASGVDGGFSRTVSCVPVVLNRRYCLRVSLTIPNLRASLHLYLPSVVVDYSLLLRLYLAPTVAVSGSIHGRWRCPTAWGVSDYKYVVGGGPRVRAVNTWFYCDDVAHSCSLHGAIGVG